MQHFHPYAGQEATVRTGHGTTDWFQIGKGVHQGCILSPCLFNLYAEYIMRNAGLEEAQAGIKIPGTCRILVPQPEVEPVPLQWKRSLNRCTAREIPCFLLFIALKGLPRWLGGK